MSNKSKKRVALLVTLLAFSTISASALVSCNSIANTVFKDGKVFKVISVTKHDHTKTANKIQIKKKGLLLNESSLKSNR